MRSYLGSSSLASGYIATLGAFVIWGFAPLFWRLLEHVDSSELLSYRIVFAMLVATVAVGISDPHLKSFQALKQRRVLVIVGAGTALIATNWFVFLWAMSNERVTEISLGYYSNPLLNVALGRILLKERLPPIQGLAVSIAATSVVYLIWSLGTIPWVAITLAVTFSIYGLVRKRSPVPALPGLLLETTICAPFCLGYLYFYTQPSWGILRAASTYETILLVASGVITALPLFLFSFGARRLPYSTVGMLQYLAPSLQLISATFIFKEPFTQEHAITFGCIWTALIIYTISVVRR